MSQTLEEIIEEILNITKYGDTVAVYDPNQAIVGLLFGPHSTPELITNTIHIAYDQWGTYSFVIEKLDNGHTYFWSTLDEFDTKRCVLTKSTEANTFNI